MSDFFGHSDAGDVLAQILHQPFKFALIGRLTDESERANGNIAAGALNILTEQERRVDERLPYEIDELAESLAGPVLDDMTMQQDAAREERTSNFRLTLVIEAAVLLKKCGVDGSDVCRNKLAPFVTGAIKLLPFATDGVGRASSTYFESAEPLTAGNRGRAR